MKIYNKRNSIGVLLKSMSAFIDEKNEAFVVDREKLQSGERECAIMPNNFLNKTLKVH